MLGDPVGRGTILNHDELTATFGPAPAAHDGATTFTLGLAFSEEVAVSAAVLRDAALAVSGGSVTAVRGVDAASTRDWEIEVAPSGTGDVTVSLARRTDCAAAGAVCTADGQPLEASVEAVVAHAAPTLAVAGVPQVGNTLEATFAAPPAGTVTYRWLRGGEEIAGAEASTYAPTAADVGHRLSVRAARGGATATSAATDPVWPAPANPALAAGEEELLSAMAYAGVAHVPDLARRLRPGAGPVVRDHGRHLVRGRRNVARGEPVRRSTSTGPSCWRRAARCPGRRGWWRTGTATGSGIWRPGRRAGWRC